MKKALLAGACAAVIALALAACSDSSRHSSVERANSNLYGGTLRVGTEPLGVTAFRLPGSAQYALDPQFERGADGAWELFRCCLLRTLLSLPGRTPGQRNTVLQPDLASSLPTVSSDRLTWTFHLKRGLRYAPPYQQTEITAGDVVRALEREFRLGTRAGYAFYYTPIQGTRAFAEGRASSISGLEVPDPHTLVIHLTEPIGDLGYRFALPATAPIPPGADRGHDPGYGRYLVSSGPYMIAGSERMNFESPPAKQRPAAGWTYDWRLRNGQPRLLRPETLLLVRNPSWSREHDALRPAYADRIWVQMSSNAARFSRLVERSRLDLIFFGQPTLDQLRRFRSTPALRSRLHIDPLSEVDYIGLNLAQPPFDDVHVRRALNFVIDRPALVRLSNEHSFVTGLLYTAVATHALPDSVESGLLASYDPYVGTAGADLGAARSEMAKSRYDHNRDGRCDARVCDDVVAVGTDTDTSSQRRPIDTAIVRAFRRLGVRLAVRHLPWAKAETMLRPGTHVGLFTEGGWVVDFPDGASFAPVFQHPTDSLNNDFALLGATAMQMRRWGYRVDRVPSVDAEISRCSATIGQARPACWATLDQRLMERVVPWVPWGRDMDIHVVSRRVSRYAHDDLSSLPALDAIALRRHAP